LPDAGPGTPVDEVDELKKSADFLRRWRFDVALAHVGELDTVLVPEQADYFTGGPRVYYTDDSLVQNPSGLVERCLSNRLMEIKDLTREGSKSGRREVSDDEIQLCIRRFQDSKVGNILFNNCEVSKEDADCFADSLVTESLLNIKQHPNATTGLIAIAVLGRSREMILAVADNGDSIASTILDTYNRRQAAPLTTNGLAKASLQARADIINFATQPNVSRKTPNRLGADEEVGLGLTYIKEDTVAKFSGKLRIVSESVQLIYANDIKSAPEVKEWPHKWKGNLLRISIPLKAKRY
jgi:hypothetical protein